MEKKSDQINNLEKELAITKAWLEAFFEDAPDAYFVCDITGTFVNGNKAAEKMSGYERGEIIGKNMLKIKIIPLSQIPRLALRLAAHAAKHEVAPEEYTIIRKDGKEVPVEITGTVVIVDGKPLIMGIARDITLRKRIERDLRDSEEQLDAIFEGSKDGIVLLDKTGKVIKINKTLIELGGVKENEIVGQRIGVLKMFTPASIIKMMSAFARTLSGLSVSPYEVEAIGAGGKKMIAEIHGSIGYRNGESIGVVAVLRNITERKAVEEEIIKKTVELEKFNKLAVGRELKIIELKNKVKELEAQLGKIEGGNITT
ncbi:MAG: PAS domain S-box protein [bacterium]